MKAAAAKRRRFGYRRIGMMLEREGMIINHKKLDRLYPEEKLSVTRRRGRKRAPGPRLADADAGGSEAGRALVAGLPVL
jgi:putative transposase